MGAYSGVQSGECIAVIQPRLPNQENRFDILRRIFLNRAAIVGNIPHLVREQSFQMDNQTTTIVYQCPVDNFCRSTGQAQVECEPRLFISRVATPDCPAIILSSLESPREFRIERDVENDVVIFQGDVMVIG